MKEYPLEKYRFFKTGTGTIIAETTYAGRRIRAKAVPNPEDEFSEDVGRRLAAARCSEKVAVRRNRTLKEKLREARLRLADAEKEVLEIERALADSNEETIRSSEKVSGILLGLK